mmetsp:Transcript_42229/g.106529  ORF Transcript_42229/g.106529 Transcript_42229/m.106529 type:complete len:216 (-) Transcript_42229:1657-2304(-)
MTCPHRPWLRTHGPPASAAAAARPSAPRGTQRTKESQAWTRGRGCCCAAARGGQTRWPVPAAAPVCPGPAAVWPPGAAAASVSRACPACTRGGPHSAGPHQGQRTRGRAIRAQPHRATRGPQDLPQAGRSPCLLTWLCRPHGCMQVPATLAAASAGEWEQTGRTKGQGPRQRCHRQASGGGRRPLPGRTMPWLLGNTAALARVDASGRRRKLHSS